MKLPPQVINIQNFMGDFVGDIELPEITPTQKEEFLRTGRIKNTRIRVFTKNLKITNRQPQKVAQA